MNTEEQSYVAELQWLLLSKATTQIYGQVLGSILDQTLAINDHIWYWDDVASSYRYATLYSLQTSPLRLYEAGQAALRTFRARGGLQAGWQQFYTLVEDTVQGRSLARLKRRELSPIAMAHSEARTKQRALMKLKDASASSLGLLLDVGQPHVDVSVISASSTEGFSLQEHLTESVSRSIALIESLLERMQLENFDMHDGEDVAQQAYTASSESTKASMANVAERLDTIMNSLIPQYKATSTKRIETNGRPSRLIRYWLPTLVAVLSSSTVLRILVHRQADIATWIRDFGVTVMDFWSNWVVDPTRKLIGTIRHDPTSEVAIISKRSLEGDRDSLERMVVDFAVQHPDNGNLTEAEIATIRMKVREGDLTPVLKAYEKDIASPFMGAVRGNLIQALLIQIQKTKVDVEIAMGGIDSLLKSQELLFGLIGVTPGVLIVFASFRYLRRVFGDRGAKNQGRKRSQVLTVLRRIDRVLSAAEPVEGRLSYKDYGLLLIETHELRELAHAMFPRQIFREFKVDLEELNNIHNGPQRQKDALQRIRWSYAKWY